MDNGQKIELDVVRRIEKKRIVESSRIENQSAVILDQEKLLFLNSIVPLWVSTRVAASYLGISPNALRIRKCRGDIECKYFGKELRFDLNYLQTLFSDKRKIAKGE